MAKVVRIPGCGESRSYPIHFLFDGVRKMLPDYFSISEDIPPSLFDLEISTDHYYFVFKDEKVCRFDLQRRKYCLPSIQEVLWAVGFMSVELASVISEKPVRFMHSPFHAHNSQSKGSETWRQIIVSRKGAGYSLETVGVGDDSPNSSLVYTFSKEDIPLRKLTKEQWLLCGK